MRRIGTVQRIEAGLEAGGGVSERVEAFRSESERIESERFLETDRSGSKLRFEAKWSFGAIWCGRKRGGTRRIEWIRRKRSVLDSK